jgi:hypothetical protein
MQDEHVYWNKHSNAIDELYHTLDDSDFVFLNKKIAEKADELFEAAGPLSDAMGVKFWMWPEHQKGDETRFALWPWGNVDRGGTGDPTEMAKYSELAEDVLGKLSVFMRSFDELLELFHRELHLAAEELQPKIS